MQLTTLDHRQAADYLSECTILARLDPEPEMAIYILEHDRRDVLMFWGRLSGGATVVYPNDMFDHDPAWQGSIHDNARAAMRAAAQGDASPPAG